MSGLVIGSASIAKGALCGNNTKITIINRVGRRISFVISPAKSARQHEKKSL
jgi:hypothetical protein